ncbi:sialidase family protein [Edaphobacter modestus]|uniref:Putative neuraminidase n=1 Tax=Edaphobacter modestus TaxID=388466 RepID=A0A4Q7YYP6_9BACT|nr:sialidase family protein [Edaphobacter modestus]RZU42878.1 putative neuraminidase [Edaphobacter modestus]
MHKPKPISWHLPLLLLALSLPRLHAETSPASKEFVYTTAPFPSAHASTLVQLKNGDILAAWFGGAKEGATDVAIWGSRRTSSGWSAPFLLVREPNVPCWNPVLFETHDGKLWLYYKYGRNVREWTGARLVSSDQGQTWSSPEHLPAGLLGPIKDKPLVLDNGTIVSGTSVESYSSWAVWVDRSTDDGKTWHRSGPITVPASLKPSPAPAEPPLKPGAEHVTGIIQPAVVHLGKKHLRLYARSTRDIGRICAADSFDDGITWTDAHPLDLPNPNSGIDAVGLRDGRVVLIYNNTISGRTPLNLAVSKDGEHFTMFHTLEDEPGEYSYPAIIQGRDSNVYATYTWNRKRISFARIPLSSIH